MFHRVFTSRLWSAIALGLSLCVSLSPPSQAGDLILYSRSLEPVDCRYGSGAPAEDTQLGAMTLTFGARWSHTAGAAGINWVQCGAAAAVARNLSLTPTSPDHAIVLSAPPERALNVLMYGYLPTAPMGDFAAMQQQIASDYALFGPANVMLNVVFTQHSDFDIYTPANYPRIYGEGGFDVVEADMLMLAQIRAGAHIRPYTALETANYWNAAVRAVTQAEQYWGHPHWLCNNYLFSTHAAVADLTTLDQLQAYMGGLDPAGPKLLGDFNGSWGVIGWYLAAVSDVAGYAAVSPAITADAVNATAITNLITVSDYCAYEGVNNCTNGVNHGLAPGALPASFVQGPTPNYAGYSETSFFMFPSMANPAEPLFAAQLPLGPVRAPMMYVDAFTLSAHNCAQESECNTDATAFFARMDTLQSLQAITYSSDLGPAATPRRLLPANQAFWAAAPANADPLYPQFRNMLNTAQAFPNTITAEQKTALKAQVCAALQAQRPAFVC